MSVMNKALSEMGDLREAYQDYVNKNVAKGKPVKKSFEQWNTFKSCSFSCEHCLKNFDTYIFQEQKNTPRFCSEEHSVLHNLRSINPNDKLGIEDILRQVEKLGIIKEAMHVLNMADANNEKYVHETYKPQRRQVPTTREHVQKVNTRRRTERMLDFRCPTPYKQTFQSLDEAQSFIDMVHSDDPGLHPYLCRCGAHHFGHKKGTKRPGTPLAAPVSDSEALWCVSPKLTHYATAEAAEAYVAEEVPAEVAALGVRVKKCSCDRYRLSFSGAAREKQRKLASQRRMAIS